MSLKVHFQHKKGKDRLANATRISLSNSGSVLSRAQHFRGVLKLLHGGACSAPRAQLALPLLCSSATPALLLFSLPKFANSPRGIAELVRLFPSCGISLHKNILFSSKSLFSFSYFFFVFPQQPTHSPMNLHRFQPSATGDLRRWLSPLALALCAWSRSDVALFFLLPLETSPNPFAVETRGWWHSNPPSVSTCLPPLLLSPLLPPGDVPARSRDPCNP